jgi:hypothetical protein
MMDQDCKMNKWSKYEDSVPTNKAKKEIPK